MKNWFHVGAYTPGTLGAPYFRPLIPSAGNRPVAATANRASVRYPFQIHFSINGQKPTASDVTTWTSMNAYEVKAVVEKVFSVYCQPQLPMTPDEFTFSIRTICSRPGHLVRAELLRNVGGVTQHVTWNSTAGDWQVL